jgi:hypothetical protein
VAILSSDDSAARSSGVVSASGFVIVIVSLAY